mgnify:CR=1 FL=1
MSLAAEVKTYRDLRVWQEAMNTARLVHRCTQSFPVEERYGLTNQLRRCAVSIPSNIAEGFGRRSRRDYARFLNVAMASLYELETQLLLARDFAYLSSEVYMDVTGQVDHVESMLAGLIRKIGQARHASPWCLSALVPQCPSALVP